MPTLSPDHQRKLDELRDKFEDELDKSYGDGIGHFAYGANTRHVADMALEYMTQASLYKNPMPTTPPRTNADIAWDCIKEFRDSDRRAMVMNSVTNALDQKDRLFASVIKAEVEKQIEKDIDLAKNAEDYGDEGITRHVIIEDLREQLTPDAPSNSIEE